MRYTAIADVSKTLVELIRDNVVPDLIAKEDSIGLCTPDNTGDFLLGIYLYNVEQSESFRISGRQNEGLHHQKYPPIVLDLHYMITPYYKSDIKFLALDEQVLLGRIIQILNDNGVIFADSGEPVELELENISLDDRQKIWTADSAYRTSVFLSARAVIVESARQSEISRVSEVHIYADQKKR